MEKSAQWGEAELRGVKGFREKLNSPFPLCEIYALLLVRLRFDAQAYAELWLRKCFKVLWSHLAFNSEFIKISHYNSELQFNSPHCNCRQTLSVNVRIDQIWITKLRPSANKSLRYFVTKRSGRSPRHAFNFVVAGPRRNMAKTVSVYFLATKVVLMVCLQMNFWPT